MQPDFVFSEEEHHALYALLSSLHANPYQQFLFFLDEIHALRDSPSLPQRYRDFCRGLRTRDLQASPIVYMSHCPIDCELPRLEDGDPVGAKYRLKRTHICEGFLALYAVLTETQIIAHLSVNDGDFFHDIYPKKSMYDSQSQKTLNGLRFHRDFTNHFVSPDFVNTIALRDTPENEVYSSFAINAQVLGSLDEQTQAVLRQPRFHTPYDDVSTRETRVRLGPAAVHPVLSQEVCLRIFEGRTVGLDEEAHGALARLTQALHRHKLLHQSRPGDCVCFSNNHVIHGRDVGAVPNLESLKQRWLMKTHNVYSLQRYQHHFLDDRYGVVNG